MSSTHRTDPIGLRLSKLLITNQNVKYISTRFFCNTMEIRLPKIAVVGEMDRKEKKLSRMKVCHWKAACPMVSY